MENSSANKQNVQNDEEYYSDQPQSEDIDIEMDS